MPIPDLTIEVKFGRGCSERFIKCSCKTSASSLALYLPVRYGCRNRKSPQETSIGNGNGIDKRKSCFTRRATVRELRLDANGFRIGRLRDQEVCPKHRQAALGTLVPDRRVRERRDGAGEAATGRPGGRNTG